MLCAGSTPRRTLCTRSGEPLHLTSPVISSCKLQFLFATIDDQFQEKTGNFAPPLNRSLVQDLSLTTCVRTLPLSLFRNCEYNRKKSATCAATGGTNWIRWCCCTAPGEDVQTLCPVKTSDCTANTTWDAAGMHCTFREWTSLDRIVDVFSNVNVRDDGIDSAPLFTTTGINFGKNQLASITCSAHDPAILAVVAPSAIQFPSGGAEATMRVRGVSDRQHTHRTSKITCSILALGSTYTFTIAVNVQNVLQPSYSAICSLPKGADPMSPDLDCSETLTTNGNSSMVLVAGMCSSCPDPAFTSQTRVKIANVDVPAAVVAGSYGQRLIAKVRIIVSVPPAGEIEDQCISPFPPPLSLV